MNTETRNKGQVENEKLGAKWYNLRVIIKTSSTTGNKGREMLTLQARQIATLTLSTIRKLSQHKNTSKVKRTNNHDVEITRHAINNDKLSKNMKVGVRYCFLGGTVDGGLCGRG